jgi:deazaflavin-dependent oxidoreductase (nitroreductase family)
MLGVMEALTSERGLNVDKYLVRYSGHSLLNHVFARQNGISARPAILLRSLGRRSGVWREAVLPYFPHGEEIVIVGSRGGMPTDPQWVGNLSSYPEAEVFLDRHLYLMSARKLTGEEYAAAWDVVTRLVPTYLEYQDRCKDTRQIPLVALSYD